MSSFAEEFPGVSKFSSAHVSKAVFLRVDVMYSGMREYHRGQIMSRSSNETKPRDKVYGEKDDSFGAIDTICLVTKVVRSPAVKATTKFLGSVASNVVAGAICEAGKRAIDGLLDG